MMKAIRKNVITVFTLTFAMVMLMATGCAFGDEVRGNGKVVTQERDVSGFDGIQVGGAFDVYLTQGSAESLRLEAEENLLEYIKTEVVGNTLKIYTRQNLKPKKDMKVYITFKDIEDLDFSGACDVVGENRFELDELDIDASGAVDVELQMKVEEFNGDFSGASDVHLMGAASKMDLDVSGASELNAEEFEVGEMSLDISGSGNAKVFVTGSMEVEVSGAASVKYKGNPSIEMDVSGAGSIKKL